MSGSLAPYSPGHPSTLSSKEYLQGASYVYQRVMGAGLATTLSEIRTLWPKAEPDWRVQDWHRGAADSLATFVDVLEQAQGEMN